MANPILQFSDLWWSLAFLIGALVFGAVVRFSWIRQDTLVVFLLFKMVLCLGFSFLNLMNEPDYDCAIHYLWGQEYAGRFGDLLRGKSFEYLTHYPFFGFDGINTDRFRSFTGLFVAATGGSFMACALIMTCFGAIGQLLIYKYLRDRFPEIKEWYFLLVLFHPSLALWSGGLNKDALGILALGILIYHADRFLVKNNPLNALGVLVGLQVGLAFRSFVLVLFFVFLLAVVWDRIIRRSRSSAAIALVYSYGALALSLGVLVFFLRNYGRDMVVAQNESNAMYASMEGGSTFENAELSFSLRGLLALPIGVFNSLLRPLPWEARKASQLFAAVENLFVLLLVIRGWFAYFRTISPSRRREVSGIMWGFGLMTLICAAGVGLYSSNLGTISRYRIPLVPLLVAAPCLALGYVDFERQYRRAAGPRERFRDGPTPLVRPVGDRSRRNDRGTWRKSWR